MAVSSETSSNSSERTKGTNHSDASQSHHPSKSRFRTVSGTGKFKWNWKLPPQIVSSKRGSKL